MRTGSGVGLHEMTGAAVGFPGATLGSGVGFGVGLCVVGIEVGDAVGANSGGTYGKTPPPYFPPVTQSWQPGTQSSSSTR